MNEKIVKFERPSVKIVRIEAEVTRSNIEYLSRETRHDMARQRYYSGEISVQEYMTIIHAHECPNCGGVHSHDH